jgi:hypothetical protein
MSSIQTYASHLKAVRKSFADSISAEMSNVVLAHLAMGLSGSDILRRVKVAWP